MTTGIAVPRAPSGEYATIGLACLAGMAFAGTDLGPLREQLIARFTADSRDAAALMDLATITQLAGDRASGLALQQRALEQQRLYWQPSPRGGDGIRLLVFMAAGDFMANTPVDFLIEGTSVSLHLLYVAPGMRLPPAIPEHDVALVAIGESDDNRAILQALEHVVRLWPRPVLNAPDRIARLSRDGAAALLTSEAGLVVPPTFRIERAALAAGSTAGLRFPIIARPIASHAGQGLVRLDDAAAASRYAAERTERELYLAPFIDYSGADGLFRKYRIAFIEGRPHPCHMAVSEHWIVHYLSAGMAESAAKRAEEARFMSDFANGFAARHANALTRLAERVDLDYFAIDCGETKEGELLLFEADVAMIVHAMDPPETYPYKRPAMNKLFRAFEELLRRRAATGARAETMTAGA